MANLEEMRQQRHNDINEVIAIMYDLQQNQWNILDFLTSLRQGQRHTNDRIDDMEAHLTHVEFHAHHEPVPPAPPTYGVGQAPDFLH